MPLHNDVKIIHVMKEVLNEKLDKGHAEILNNQTKLLEIQQKSNKLIETLPQKSDINKLMENISQIKSKIENPQNDNNVATLQEELEETKRLLEEEIKYPTAFSDKPPVMNEKIYSER